MIGLVAAHPALLPASSALLRPRWNTARIHTMTAKAVASSVPPTRHFNPDDATPEDWAIVSSVLAQFAAAERVDRLREVLSKRRAGLHIVLENLSNPYDVAAILRTAEGLGIHHVHCVETKKKAHSIAFKQDGEDSTNISLRRASQATTRTSGQRRVTKRALGNVAMGASRWLTVRNYRNTAECYTALKNDYASEVRIFASMPAPDYDLGNRISQLDRSTNLGTSGPPVKRWRKALTARPLDTCLAELATAEDADASGATSSHPPGAIALVFGEDGKLSRKALEHADESFHLPGVVGLTKSFSLSLTMAMSVYSVLSAGVAPEGTLSEAERTELMGRWLLRDVRAAEQILRKEAKLELVKK